MKRFATYLLLLGLDIALLNVDPTHATAQELNEKHLKSKAPGVAFGLRPDYACVA